MLYRNGREAKNGDTIVQLADGKVAAFGVLHLASLDDDHCNGTIETLQPRSEFACITDCLHIDDVNALIKEKGIATRH